MAQGSRDGIRKPVCNTVLRARGSDLDLVRELPYGPRHMTAALRPDRCQHPTYAPVVLKDFPCSHGGVHRCCKDLALAAGHFREDEMTSQAATWNSPAMNSAWALMSLPPMLRTWPFLIIAIAS
jgi:hypothetical protein